MNDVVYHHIIFSYYLKKKKINRVPQQILVTETHKCISFNNVKPWKILMDYLKNHLVSHLAKSEIAKEMFDSLKKLFERDSPSRSIALRTLLHTIKMNRS